MNKKLRIQRFPIFSEKRHRTKNNNPFILNKCKDQWNSKQVNWKIKDTTEKKSERKIERLWNFFRMTCVSNLESFHKVLSPFLNNSSLNEQEGKGNVTSKNKYYIQTYMYAISSFAILAYYFCISIFFLGKSCKTLNLATVNQLSKKSFIQSNR